MKSFDRRCIRRFQASNRLVVDLCRIQQCVHLGVSLVHLDFRFFLDLLGRVHQDVLVLQNMVLIRAREHLVEWDQVHDVHLGMGLHDGARFSRDFLNDFDRAEEIPGPAFFESSTVLGFHLTDFPLFATYGPAVVALDADVDFDYYEAFFDDVHAVALVSYVVENCSCSELLNDR
jgi:hypothetical protein